MVNDYLRIFGKKYRRPREWSRSIQRFPWRPVRR
jgi:hypothetical protein